MLGSVLKVILYIYIMPCLVGEGVNRILKIDGTIVKDYLIGNIFIWALFQLVTVPLVLMKEKFSLVVLIINVVLFGICFFVVFQEVILKRGSGLSWKKYKKRIPRVNATDMIAMIIMEVMIVALLFVIIFLQHTDADDSRFVVNAVEIVRTNRMFLTDLITGQELEIWVGELVKDVTSPWAVYIAYYAKMTGIAVVIMAHSVLPVSLIFCALAVFWLLAQEFFGKNLSDKSLFMCFVILLNVYGYHSRYTAESFLLTRIWQGKAVLASVAIPAMYLICMWLYKNEKKYGYYILVAMINIGMCLLSGMGIIIGAVMVGCIGFVYGIFIKWRMTILLWMMCVPNIVYFVINYLQPSIGVFG